MKLFNKENQPTSKYASEEERGLIDKKHLRTEEFWYNKQKIEIEHFKEHGEFDRAAIRSFVLSEEIKRNLERKKDIKDSFANKRLTASYEKEIELLEKVKIDLSEEEQERIKELLILDVGDAKIKSRLLDREHDFITRRIMTERNEAFNVCPVCGRMNTIEHYVDTFNFCSRECDKFDAECTPEEREKTKMTSLKFYEDNLMSEEKAEKYGKWLDRWNKMMKEWGEE